MKCYIVFIVICFSLFENSYGQNDVTWPKFRGKETFPEYVKHMITTDSRVGGSYCAKFMSAVKFKIDENGYVDSVLISSNVKGYLYFKLPDILNSTHGQWEPVRVDGKVVKSKALILPIYFSLEGLCKSNQKPVDEMATSIESLLTFDRDSDKLFQSDVMVFNPIYIYAGFGYEDVADAIVDDDH